MSTQQTPKAPPRATLVTDEVRLSYPFLFKPKEQKRNDGTVVLKYSASLIFPNDLPKDKLTKAITECLIDKFGSDPANPQTWNKKNAGRLKMPIRDGKDYSEDPSNPREEYADSYFVGASSTRKPTVWLSDRTPAEDCIGERGVYPGCWVRAVIRAYVYETPESRGVTFSLEHIMKVRDDEPLGAGRTNPEDFFGPAPIGPASSDDSNFMD